MESEKKDYSKTVNLPKTDFAMKANLPQREPEFINKWEMEGIYEKLRDKNKGGKQFILHDGPPYANGHLHMGHALNKILKDLMVKYKAMTGHYAPYTPGWDCHGLPIEQQCMKDMKVDKHKIGIVEFRKAAADFAAKFVGIQRDEFRRLGVLGDWGKPYLTMDPKYEANIMRVFGKLAGAGYVFRQNKPVYWCPTCETALADAEVEYADHISHSVFVKFPVKEFKALKTGIDNTYVLIWTTTPWTLPANVALAFSPEAVYAKAKAVYADGKSENLIMARKLLPSVMEKAGVKEYGITEEFPGTELERVICVNPLMDRDSRGILADYVSLEDGSGVVHIAPGHGQEDYLAGLKYKLPVLSPVDDRGAFTADVPEFKGHKVFAANPLIVEKLKSLGVLLRDDKLSHQYPHCWRCKRAIIFRATPQWFIRIDEAGLRKKILETIKTVRWIPAYGENRINGMIETRPDWCLSRQRLWGVPIPVFYCEDCGEALLDEKIINAVADKVSSAGCDAWYQKTPQELAGSLQLKCAKCGGTKFRKEQDILDVWFDSGVSHEAVLASGDFPELSWPADMYLEGSDQHRGWFQTSIIPSVALRGKAPYRDVLTHGFVVDGEGKKMSKSIGNTMSPQDLIKQYGADIVRLWVATSDYREDIRISQEIIKGLVDAYRKIRNTLRFLLGNISDYSPKEVVKYSDMRELDRHCLWQLQETVKQVTAAYESFEFHRAAVSINNFCTVYLSGFYLDALKDTLYCDRKDSPARRSAQTAMLEACSVLTRLLAPILAFTSEEAWQELRKLQPKLPGSVLLAEFPKADENKMFSGEARERWDKLFKLREKALSACETLRRDKKIGSNLEAGIEIQDNGGLKKIDKELLAAATGTWDLSVSGVTDRGSPSGDIEVKAAVSAHPKCVRCWRHREDVSVSNKFGDNLCGRCVSALE